MAIPAPEVLAHCLRKLALSNNCTLILLIVATASAGFASHLLYFIHGEHHLEAVPLLRLGLLLPPSIYSLSLYLAHPSPFLLTTAICLPYVAALFTSILVYRCFFHPLHQFPGPRLARLSKWWHSCKVARCSDNHLLMKRLYEEYGPFIRTGPNELTIVHPDVMRAILETSTKCRKAPWYDLLYPNYCLGTMRDRKLHAARRRIWEPAFSSKALYEYETPIREYAELLEARIARNVALKEPMDVTEWFRRYSFDMMGVMGFGEPLGMLSEKEGSLIRQFIKGTSVHGPLAPVTYMFQVLAQLPRAMDNWNKMLAWCASEIEKLKTVLQEAYAIDLRAWALDIDGVYKVVSWLIDSSRNAGTLEQDLSLLAGEALFVVAAGSDTITTALTTIFYNLALHPPHQQIVVEELRGADPTDQRVLSTKEHLNAVINETLRMYHPIPTGLVRDTPPEGLIIGDHFVPGNVTIRPAAHLIGRLEEAYPRANEFIPERWYSRPELMKKQDAAPPFSMGRYMCIGKQFAYLQMRLLVAMLVTKYEVAFAEGEDGSSLFKDAMDLFVLNMGKLELTFTPRKP